MNEWRIIQTPASSAAYNMACDEALLLSFIKNKSKALLRVYGWNPAAVSFGRFQDTSSVHKIDGIDYVRRMTGGGAIFHNDEITYSVVCSADNISGIADIKDSYLRINEFIFKTYRKLGLSPCYAAHYYPELFKNKREKSMICFEGLEPYDIVLDGRKIGGNAQYRKEGSLMQHGSIPLSNNRTLLQSIFPTADQSTTLMTSLAECGIKTSKSLLRDLLIECFIENLSVSFQNDGINEDEAALCSSLINEKYSNRKWTWNRSQGLHKNRPG